MLTSAEGSEILGCSRDLLFEHLYHNAATSIAISTLSPNLDIHEHLNMLHVKLWHRIALILLVIIIHATCEHLCRSLLLFRILILLGFTLFLLA